MMNIVCCDLEGVFTPEIWINVAERTGIPELRITTRDEPDYDKLMKYRINILKKKGLKLKDITDVISTLNPLPGAKEFLLWMRRLTQVIIVSDTFIQFGMPLMEKLDFPTLLCHSLVINDDGAITGYNLRTTDPKRKTVSALKSLNYRVIAMGDSYNDTSMLLEADAGILFRPPENVIRDFPQFRVTTEYNQLKDIISEELNNNNL
ncbi:MAG: bifunctional phosphoserine phosphatase/homoserine phosphotransferase ThrH [Lentimicrobiaceae bacterium]|nr:bifunctional phosphoserine phosphatase/homoserine phosphotransferase ThrH [Lentimicrobiaceae bacterium]